MSLNNGSVATPGDGRQAWLVLASEGPARGLARHAPGCDVVTVDSAEAFLRLLLDARPRLAVVGLPPAGDREMAGAVREREQRSALRIILINRPIDVDGRLRALRLGFDDAVPDTIDAAELAGRAAILVGRPQARPPVRLAVAADMELDPIAHRLLREGSDVHIRPKEFAILALLATHPERVFTRGEIIERVWGGDHVGDPRTVDVHVRWIRSKIELDPDRPIHLVTIRGSGYRLDPSGTGRGPDRFARATLTEP